MPLKQVAENEQEGDCTPCGMGLYSETEGAASNETCLSCMPGTYQSSPGKFLTWLLFLKNR